MSNALRAFTRNFEVPRYPEPRFPGFDLGPRPQKPEKPEKPVNKPRPPRPGKPPLRPIDRELILGVHDGIEQLLGGWTRFGERP